MTINYITVITMHHFGATMHHYTTVPLQSYYAPPHHVIKQHGGITCEDNACVWKRGGGLSKLCNRLALTPLTDCAN